jgi:hypothetical protein
VQKNTFKLKNAQVVGLNYNSECESLNYFSVVFIINFTFFTDYFISLLGHFNTKKLRAVGQICTVNENKTKLEL